MSIKNFFDGGKQISDSAGLPLNGGKCNFYEPGTTTLKTTYTTSAISVANANPVVLDSAGRANIWLNGNYRVIVKDSTGATTIYDEDNINPETASSLTAISTDTTLVLADKAKFYQASGAITITLTSAATLGAGWYVYIRNNGSSNITLTGANTANTFNGTAFSSSTITLFAGETCLVVVNSAADGFITFVQKNAFTTGDAKLTLKTTADAGWILANDTSIGNAASGATGRANADTSALFTLLWTNIIDTWCPVSTGRGASAAADYAADKTITLPRTLGRALAVSGAGSGLTSRALGEYLGTETITLTDAGLPAGTIRTVATGTSYVLGGTGPILTVYDKTAAATAFASMTPDSFWNVMIKL